jgi:ribosomal protein L11 methyltransferase
VNYTGRSRVTPSTVARLETSEQMAHRIADLITESFADEGVAVELWDAGGARWRVALHFRSAPDNDAVRKLVATVGGRDVAAALSFARIAPADWVRESLSGLKPVVAGRFIVHGAHDRARIPVNRIGIEIEAALAFGTGHHGTTRGCLLALDRLCKSLSRPIPAPSPCKGEGRGGGRGTRRQRDKTSTRLASARRSAPFGGRTRILDLGTGSGVLAIAAARTLRQRVLATDIDPAAVNVARANARLNRAGTMIEVINADGVTAQSLRRRAPFVLVFANILLGPLQRIAAPLQKLTAPGARIVLSGLLPVQANAALAAHSAFVLERRIDLDGWTTLMMARHSRRSRAVAGRRRHL